VKDFGKHTDKLLIGLGIGFYVISLFEPFFKIGPYYTTIGNTFESIVYSYIGVLLLAISFIIKKLKMLTRIISLIFFSIPLVYVLLLVSNPPGTMGGWPLGIAIGAYLYLAGIIMLWLAIIFEFIMKKYLKYPGHLRRPEP
jgi:hypothetical protein